MEKYSLETIHQALDSKEKELEDIKAEVTQAETALEAVKAEVAQAENMVASARQKLTNFLAGYTKNPPEDTLKGKPLRVYVKSVLMNSNEPLTVKDIEELVLEAGYVTTSKKNFRTIILQSLIKDSEFKRVTKPRTKPARYTLEEA